MTTATPISSPLNMNSSIIAVPPPNDHELIDELFGIDLAHQRAALRFSSSLMLAIDSIVWSFSATRTRFRSQAGCADELVFPSRAAREA
jgi:hypothetical protein